jgi:DNA-binding transcriptional LysR family regulator
MAQRTSTLPGFSKVRSFNSPNTGLCLIRAGTGAGWILSDVGDNIDELVRIGEPVDPFGSALWLLTHEDLRTTPRFRAFMAEQLTGGPTKAR